MKTLGRLLALGLSAGGALWAFGAAALLAVGVAGVVVLFSVALMLGAVTVDEVRQRGTGLTLRPLAFWAVCLALTTFAVWSLATAANPVDAVRIRAGAVTSALLGLAIGGLMSVRDQRAV